MDWRRIVKGHTLRLEGIRNSKNNQRKITIAAPSVGFLRLPLKCKNYRIRS